MWGGARFFSFYYLPCNDFCFGVILLLETFEAHAGVLREGGGCSAHAVSGATVGAPGGGGADECEGECDAEDHFCVGGRGCKGFLEKS